MDGDLRALYIVWLASRPDGNRRRGDRDDRDSTKTRLKTRLISPPFRPTSACSRRSRRWQSCCRYRRNSS
jgi:hypothetical protein